MTRIESDLLGEVAIPDEALYGAQTQRAVENFPASGQRTLGSFPALVRALLMVKKAAALANAAAGFLPEEKARAIAGAADALLEQGWDGHFPVHVLHGGGGTSANMNANEVLANLAEERLGGRRGEYRLIHPNDHANLNQSTNDVYPTACHVAAILQWAGLRRSLTSLGDALEERAETYRDQVRLARTCLQDAVEIRFGDYLGGMTRQIGRLGARLSTSVEALYAVNLGGSIVGRVEDVPGAYFERVIHHLVAVTGEARLHRAENLFDAAQNPDDLTAVSAALDITARALIKIACDFRVLSSGPQAGLNEVRLPAVQPGSSIMPGKVNPVIPEFLIQCCFRVIGNHAMCTAGLDHGELDLNVWESSMVFAILESMELLEAGITALTGRCVQGLEPVVETNDARVQTITPRLTRLARQHGYSRITAICKLAAGDFGRLEALLDEAFPRGDEG
jgi:aspartate ammonia-lyase